MVPEVRQQPRVVVVRERRVVVIETRITCVNEPNVRWLHEQRQVAMDSRHNVVIQQVSQVRDSGHPAGLTGERRRNPMGRSG